MLSELNFMADKKGRSVFKAPSVADLIIRLEQTNPSCTMNLPICLDMKQKIDINKMERAVNRVIAENDVLRAIALIKDIKNNQHLLNGNFNSENTEYDGCKVRFLKEFHYELPVRIVSGADDEEKYQNALALLNQDLKTRIDITNSIPVRTWLYQLDENHFWLACAVHHYICDPLTLSMYLKAVLSYYFDENSSQIFGTGSSFMDYLGETEDLYANDEGKKIEAFWLKEYQDFEPLKLEKQQIVDRSDMPAGIAFDKANIERIAKENNTNIFNVIMMIYHIVYTKLYHFKDSSIAFAVNGRKEKRYNTTMGLFIQVVNSRLQFEENQTLKEAYKALHHNVVIAFTNSSAYMKYKSPFIISYQVSTQIGTDQMPFEIVRADTSYLSAPGIAFALMETNHGISGSNVADFQYFSGKDVKKVVECCMETQQQLITSDKSRKISDLFTVSADDSGIIEI